MRWRHILEPLRRDCCVNLKTIPLLTTNVQMFFMKFFVQNCSLLAAFPKVVADVFDIIYGAQLVTPNRETITFCVPPHDLDEGLSWWMGVKVCGLLLKNLNKWISTATTTMPRLAWNMNTHSFFHSQTKKQIKTTLMCWYASNSNNVDGGDKNANVGLACLPVDCLRIIFEFVCAPPFVPIKICFGCGVVTNNRCGRCKQVYFCGRSCQIAQNAFHKKWCQEYAQSTNTVTVSLPTIDNWKKHKETSMIPVSSWEDALLAQYVRDYCYTHSEDRPRLEKCVDLKRKRTQ